VGTCDCHLQASEAMLLLRKSRSGPGGGVGTEANSLPSTPAADAQSVTLVKAEPTSEVACAPTEVIWPAAPVAALTISDVKGRSRGLAEAALMERARARAEISCMVGCLYWGYY